MLSLDEDALTCDFAETYHVLNWRELPPRLAATLAAGLPASSRIMKKAGVAITTETAIAAALLDAANKIAWMLAGGSRSGYDMPKSVLAELTGQQETSDVDHYASGEEYLKARERLLSKLQNQGERTCQLN